jgi:hypothetical protein
MNSSRFQVLGAQFVFQVRFTASEFGFDVRIGTEGNSDVELRTEPEHEQGSENPEV